MKKDLTQRLLLGGIANLLLFTPLMALDLSKLPPSGEIISQTQLKYIDTQIPFLNYMTSLDNFDHQFGKNFGSTSLIKTYFKDKKTSHFAFIDNKSNLLIEGEGINLDINVDTYEYLDTLKDLPRKRDIALDVPKKDYEYLTKKQIKILLDTLPDIIRSSESVDFSQAINHGNLIVFPEKKESESNPILFIDKYYNIAYIGTAFLGKEPLKMPKKLDPKEESFLKMITSSPKLSKMVIDTADDLKKTIHAKNLEKGIAFSFGSVKNKDIYAFLSTGYSAQEMLKEYKNFFNLGEKYHVNVVLISQDFKDFKIRERIENIIMTDSDEDSLKIFKKIIPAGQYEDFPQYSHLGLEKNKIFSNYLSEANQLAEKLPEKLKYTLEPLFCEFDEKTSKFSELKLKTLLKK